MRLRARRGSEARAHTRTMLPIPRLSPPGATVSKLLTNQVPMLFVSARNDPVAPADVVDPRPFDARGAGSEAAPLLLAVTREGGHSMTWPEGWRGGGRDWSTAVLCEFVAAVAEARG